MVTVVTVTVTVTVTVALALVFQPSSFSGLEAGFKLQYQDHGHWHAIIIKSLWA